MFTYDLNKIMWKLELELSTVGDSTRREFSASSSSVRFLSLRHKITSRYAVPGAELRIWLKQGKEKRLPARKKRLPARILTKARKRLLRQNATRLCVNLWENAQYKSA